MLTLFGGLRALPARTERIASLSLYQRSTTHFLPKALAVRVLSGRWAGIVDEGRAGPQAHLECGALGAISIALRSPDEIGASSPALKAAVSRRTP